MKPSITACRRLKREAVECLSSVSVQCRTLGREGNIGWRLDGRSILNDLFYILLSHGLSRRGGIGLSRNPLGIGGRSSCNCGAGRRQIGNHHLARLYRLGIGVLFRRRPWLLGEPPGKGLVATIALADGCLRFAIGRAGRAFQPNVEVLVMAVNRPDLAHEGPVAGPCLAEFLLDGRVDEDTLHLRVTCRHHHQPGIQRRPFAVVNRQKLALVQHRDEWHRLSLLHRQPGSGHGPPPDIHIETDLVRGMPCQHRTAAWLGNIAKQQARPADLLGILRKPLKKGNQLRLAPAPVAGKAHGLPTGAIGRHGDGASLAAFGIRADRLRSCGGRQRHVAEHFFCGPVFGRCGLDLPLQRRDDRHREHRCLEYSG
ncbi:hypothetical protein AT6N2_C2388 [Agrobacterium tumefaciens]|nr:hypothetical protein AT6N2_C2388 [Agrobacterium tumefaciens]